jgi:ABC-type phosphate/phosphonate transport system ATPase subunit
VKEARKSYGGFEALKGVSLTMAGGEVTALLGHNGAGKPYILFSAMPVSHLNSPPSLFATFPRKNYSLAYPELRDWSNRW